MLEFAVAQNKITLIGALVQLLDVLAWTAYQVSASPPGAAVPLALLPSAGAQLEVTD